MALYCSKKLPALLRRTASKHHSGFYLLNCLHTFIVKSKLESHQEIWKSRDFCNIVLPSENTEILDFNHLQKSDKAPFII